MARLLSPAISAGFIVVLVASTACVGLPSRSRQVAAPWTPYDSSMLPLVGVWNLPDGEPCLEISVDAAGRLGVVTSSDVPGVDVVVNGMSWDGRNLSFSEFVYLEFAPDHCYNGVRNRCVVTPVPGSTDRLRLSFDATGQPQVWELQRAR